MVCHYGISKNYFFQIILKNRNWKILIEKVQNAKKKTKIPLILWVFADKS